MGQEVGPMIGEQMIWLLAIALSIASVLTMMNLGYYIPTGALIRILVTLSWAPVAAVGLIMSSNIILITSLILCVVVQVLLIIERVTE